MSSELSKYNVEIRVETVYLEDESNPSEDHYVFAYTITIINTGLLGAKLLTRHWIIANQDGKTYEVQGDGVVGEQPYLKPGEAYQYSSGTMLDTPIGTMQGIYQLIADDGQYFEATIAPFTLAVPNKLH